MGLSLIMYGTGGGFHFLSAAFIPYTFFRFLNEKLINTKRTAHIMNCPFVFTNNIMNYFFI